MFLLKIIPYALLMLIVLKAHAQNVTNPFKVLKSKKEIVYGFDNRRTNIYEHHTVIYGVYSGVGFGKKLRFKIGISGTPFEVGKFIDSNGDMKKNRLLFVNLGEEFDFFQYHKIGLTTYLQAGVGQNYYRIINANGTSVYKGKELIIPIETGLHFSYDFFTYLKLRAGWGWRFVAPFNSRNLNGYYIKLGLSFSLKKFNESNTKKMATSRQ